MQCIGEDEASAFLVHFVYETKGLCYIEEENGKSHDYCKESKKYPCASGKHYYGCGPLHLTWNYNYGAAGDNLNIKLLTSPDILAQHPVVSFKASFWYWVHKVQPVFKHGFGANIRAMDRGECNGGNLAAVQVKIKLFKKFCEGLKVSPGSNLEC